MRHTLDFEKTISDLQDKITKLKESGSDKTSLVELNEQIEEIKSKIDKKLNDIYKNYENGILGFFEKKDQFSFLEKPFISYSDQRASFNNYEYTTINGQYDY